jgi:hypothetical protein
MRCYFPFVSFLNPFLHFGQQTRGDDDLLSQVYPHPGQVRVCDSSPVMDTRYGYHTDEAFKLSTSPVPKCISPPYAWHLCQHDRHVARMGGHSSPFSGGTISREVRCQEKHPLPVPDRAVRPGIPDREISTVTPGSPRSGRRQPPALRSTTQIPSPPAVTYLRFVGDISPRGHLLQALTALKRLRVVPLTLHIPGSGFGIPPPPALP